MESEYQPKILIVEDDVDLAEMLTGYFGAQGYAVSSTAWGESAIGMAAETLPDLIILDIHLPDINGYEVRQQLQQRHRTRDIPIIFLTERSHREDRLHGLRMEATDYITKPFDIQELRLRVRNTLHRFAESNAGNIITGLPEGKAVDTILLPLVEDHQEGWALLTVTLMGLETFRELYGFVASDAVLRVISLMLANATSEFGGERAFCGHLEQQSFVVLVPAERLHLLQERIRARSDQSLEYFYPADNRGPNTYSLDRLRLLTGVLRAEDGPFSSLAELKEMALASRRVL